MAPFSNSAKTQYLDMLYFDLCPYLNGKSFGSRNECKNYMAGICQYVLYIYIYLYIYIHIYTHIYIYIHYTIYNRGHFSFFQNIWNY